VKTLGAKIGGYEGVKVGAKIEALWSSRSEERKNSENRGNTVFFPS